MAYTQYSGKIECMDYISRKLEPSLHAALDRGKSILLLGSRQVGKTTLLSNIAHDRRINLIHPTVRRRYEEDPGLLIGEIEMLAESLEKKVLVIIDEVQKVPELMDAVQDLIGRQIAQFILTGSSTRKLKHPKKVNLLPGRVVALRLDPLSLPELPPDAMNLEALLLYGSLPEILLTPSQKDKEIDLKTYVSTYLEEEVRAEALVRRLGKFAQFLRLAALEGYIICRTPHAIKITDRITALPWQSPTLPGSLFKDHTL